MDKKFFVFLGLLSVSFPAFAGTKVMMGQHAVSSGYGVGIQDQRTPVDQNFVQDVSKSATEQALANSISACEAAGGKPTTNIIGNKKVIQGENCSAHFHKSSGTHDSNGYDITCNNTVAIVCEGKF